VASLPSSRWPLLIVIMLTALSAPILMGGCESECASRGGHCEGDTLVICYMEGFFPQREVRSKRGCAENGQMCVDTGSTAFCAAPDPDCKPDINTSNMYCRDDTIVYCSSEVSGFATSEMPCTPHACAQTEGFPPVCATPDTPCFTRPDGQYCWDFSQDAFECYQKGRVRQNSHCNYCYINSDGKAASRMTEELCLPPRQ
jgi:hypothetical protein